MRFTKPVLDIALALAFVFLTCVASSVNAQWQPASKVGLTQAPPTQLNNLSGKSVDLSEFKGKVLVVNFWASWCEPCREEMPAIESYLKRNKSKGFEVLAISMDKPSEMDQAKQIMRNYTFLFADKKQIDFVSITIIKMHKLATVTRTLL